MWQKINHLDFATVEKKLRLLVGTTIPSPLIKKDKPRNITPTNAISSNEPIHIDKDLEVQITALLEKGRMLRLKHTRDVKLKEYIQLLITRDRIHEMSLRKEIARYFRELEK